MGYSSGERALLKLMEVFSPRYVSREEAARKGLRREFDAARRAGLIQSAGYECSVRGDDFLERADSGKPAP